MAKNSAAKSPHVSTISDLSGGIRLKSAQLQFRSQHLQAGGAAVGQDVPGAGTIQSVTATPCGLVVACSTGRRFLIGNGFSAELE